mgnify:CR=1 FL=1
MHGNGNFDHTENHRNYIACYFGADSVPSAADVFAGPADLHVPVYDLQ